MRRWCATLETSRVHYGDLVSTWNACATQCASFIFLNAAVASLFIYLFIYGSACTHKPFANCPPPPRPPHPYHRIVFPSF